MKLVANGKQEMREEWKPVQELEVYRAAQARQAEVYSKVEGLRARLVDLTGQADTLQEQLTETRSQKAAAIEKLALGEITREQYDAIKTEISRIHETLEEVTEQISFLQKNLSKVSSAILKAGQDIQGAKYAVIQKYVDHEAAEIRELVGAKMRQLCCLSAQAGIPGYAQQLEKIFPNLSFDERIVETDRAMRQLFTVGE